jgi:hypothetical protein
MQNKITRRLAFLILTLAIAAVVRLWPDNSTKGVVSSAPANASEHDATSTSMVGADRGVPTPPGARGEPAGGVASPNKSAMPQGAPVQIVVRAPATVQMGESFEATVDVDAPGGIRQLAFSITYNKSVLQLVESSEGTFTKQAGTPAQFGAEEPSDGNILVRFGVDNGWAVGGTGSVAVLQFLALKAGSSPVTVDSVTLVDNGPAATSPMSSVKQALVTVN